MKIYIENTSKEILGGGFRFIENFQKALKYRVEFVDSWKKCDIVFAFGITALDKHEVHEAVNAGKRFVLRVDNIPRKSRNKRQSPVERLKEFGKMADMVIYQSKWAKMYAGYFAGEGVVIKNGVDNKIFNKNNRSSDGNTYLYINYNDNPNKRFDEAIYWFDLEWRKEKNSHLVIAGNAPSIYLRNPEYNWDLTVPAKVEYEGIMTTPQEVAALMKTCDYLLYPSFAEAYPNTVLEALACGMKIINYSSEGGTIEAVNDSRERVKDIYEMGEEYFNLFERII